MSHERTSRRMKLNRQQMDQTLLTIITSLILGLPLLCYVLMVVLQACNAMIHNRLFRGK
jgi:hypothetical protein